MYIAILLILAMTLYGGYSGGIYESSSMFFRNMLAFILAFTLFLPASALLAGVAQPLKEYPLIDYLQVVTFAALFIATIAIWDQVKFRYFFAPDSVTLNRYADRIGGGLLGAMNGVILGGFILILWTMLPFVKFLPRDFGRVHTDRLPVDAGAVLLKSYAHSSDRMGGGRFPLTGFEADDEDDETIPQRRRRGWLWYYRTHADLTSYDMERITAAGTAAADAGVQENAQP